jgi:Polyketide cyclase / dehydrase and lipid transport
MSLDEAAGVSSLLHMEEVVVTAAAEIPVTAVAAFRAPIEAVFDYIVAEDTPTKMMLGYGPVPGVAGGELHEGPWDHPGAYRTVQLKGGGTAREEITGIRRPAYFSYRVSDFSISARYVVAAARGEWWFETWGDSTLVRWTYTFEPRSLPRTPLTFAFARLLWKGYMGRAMREAKAQAEAAAYRRTE